ncbi:MAG: hypothetical protein HYX41_01935 [Bdellovibrio sp.]|nr:hypothetical protein [Bdellovibrio sp.]
MIMKLRRVTSVYFLLLCGIAVNTTNAMQFVKDPVFGTDIEITSIQIPKTRNAWIGLYEESAEPGEKSAIYWDYIRNLKNSPDGKVLYFPVKPDSKHKSRYAPGKTYKLILFYKSSGYHSLERGAFVLGNQKVPKLNVAQTRELTSEEVAGYIHSRANLDAGASLQSN